MSTPSTSPAAAFRVVRRRLPLAPEAAAAARRVVDELRVDDLTPQLVEDLRLLVSEVVTNAVRHGRVDGADGAEIELVLRGGPDRVRVEVGDPGHGFRYDGPGVSADGEGGWGLYLVDQLAERWGIDEEPSTRVWFELVDRPTTVARVGEATLFDAIGAAIVATDPDGVITHWNRGAEELYGYPRDETVGRPVTEVMAEPHDRASAERVLARIREGRPWGGEWLAPRKDGRRVPVWVSNAPVHDARGRLVGVVGVSIDISERKRAEEELRRSEEHLRVALEAGAMGTWEWRPSDDRVAWSEPLERIHGLEPGTFGGTFEDFRRDIHPEDRERVLGEIRRVVDGDEIGYAIEYRIVRPDGRTRWLAASATAIRDDDGAVLRLVGVCTDVTDRKEAERRLVAQHAVAAALAEAESVGAATPKLLEGVGEALGFDVGAVYLVGPDADRLRCAGTWTREGRDVGRFAEATLGFSPGPGEGLPGLVWQRGEPVWIEDFATDPRMPRGPVAAEEQLHAAIAFPMRAGGELIGVLELLGRDFRRPDEALSRLLDAVGNQIGLVVARRRAEEERADLLEKERVAREAAEEANERLAFLAGAGITFTSSLDYRWTLAEVARLAVPRIADWCAVELVEPDGTISEVEIAHVDPERVALARELRRRWPTPPDAPTGVPHVIRTRQPELYPEITDEMVTASIDDPERLDLARRLGLRSLMIVPMVARGRAIGAITFATSDASGRRFDEQDLAFVGHLARRAALSIDNARLFEERARIASTLQRSLLPPTLPSVPGVEAAAAYQAAAVEHNDVGGDFYDLFELGDDTWVAAIGDVGGKGVEAAALTGLLRHTIRADALHARSPAEVLERLNTGLLRQGADRFCTVALAFVRPGDGGARIALACAGHPPPIVVRAGGAVEPVEAAGTVLGVLDEVTVEDRALELGAGDALVLFTDGLLDPRRSEPIDEDGLASLLGRYAGLDARSIADRLAAAVEDPTAAPDDVAILVLRATPPRGAA